MTVVLKPVIVITALHLLLLNCNNNNTKTAHAFAPASKSGMVGVHKQLDGHIHNQNRITSICTGNYLSASRNLSSSPLLLSSSVNEDDVGSGSYSGSDKIVSKGVEHQKAPSLLKVITLYAPVWTSIAAIIGVTKAQTISPTLGSLSIMQKSLALLMLAMGLTITPADLSRTLEQKTLLLTNAILCYGLMPLVAFLLSSTPFFGQNASEAAGIIVLGSVSGGQASNLFTLLAGGDTALSVVCTFTTTLLGVAATPLLVQYLLGRSVAINTLEVLLSVVQLTLVPLLMGLCLGRFAPKFVSRIVKYCPTLGVLATLVLVAGGAANSTAGSALMAGVDSNSGLNISIVAVAASCALPFIGGGLALALLSLPSVKKKCAEKSKRALVIETFSKSPTLATVLAKKHFDAAAAAVPAAAMVSLAIIGAFVSTVWSFWPITEKD